MYRKIIINKYVSADIETDSRFAEVMGLVGDGNRFGAERIERNSGEAVVVLSMLSDLSGHLELGDSVSTQQVYGDSYNRLVLSPFYQTVLAECGYVPDDCGIETGWMRVGSLSVAECDWGNEPNPAYPFNL